MPGYPIGTTPAFSLSVAAPGSGYAVLATSGPITKISIGRLVTRLNAMPSFYFRTILISPRPFVISASASC